MSLKSWGLILQHEIDYSWWYLFFFTLILFLAHLNSCCLSYEKSLTSHSHILPSCIKDYALGFVSV